MNDQVILIISSEAWGEIFVSKHHYAKFLSKNNKVYFLNPPSIKWHFNHLMSIPIETKNINEKLIVIDYGNPIPLMAKFPFFIQIWAFKRIIKQIKNKGLSDKKIDILWSFDLKRFFNLRQWKANACLFHAVELIEHPFFLKDAPYRHSILKSADLVLSIADLITNQIKPWNSNILKINHGINLDELSVSNELPEMPGKNRIKAGFIGNFQKSFDFELLNTLSINHPDIDFIMIGPIADSNLGSIDKQVKNNLLKYHKNENIYFIGQKPAHILKDYLYQLDINLVIYADGFHDGHCNPHKLMSYFYFGKVIVSSFVDEYKSREDLIRMVKMNSEFPTMFGDVAKNLDIENSDSKMKKRKEFAIQNSYHSIISSISQAIK